MHLLSLVAPRLVAGLILSLAFVTFALADGVEGTWRLVKRELPDGTIQTPPTVGGLATLMNGVKHVNVFWQTPEGKPASVSVISTIKLTASEYTETLIASAFDDGSGKPVVYNFSGETGTAVVTREGGRISYQQPFGAPAAVFEGDKLTATVEGVLIDYWERVK